MKHLVRHIAVVLAFAGAALVHSGMAQAAVDNASVSPTSVNISLDMPLPAMLTWQASRTETVSRPPTTRTLSSPNAELRVGGSLIGTLGGVLAKTSTLSLGQSDIATWPETLTIPAHLARKIAEAPAGSAVIHRRFSDGLSSKTASVRVFARLTSGGPLAVRRIELFFENEQRTAVVGEGERLRAVADISFRNNGLLLAEWRIVDPATSLGSQTFRRLSLVRRNLVSSGQGRVRLTSPPLPTQAAGTYVVSLAILNEGAALQTPILRYAVIPDGTGRLAGIPQVIETFAPLDNAALTRDTVFSWQPVPGAAAYRVDIMRRNGLGEPKFVTGKLVPGYDTRLSLTALSFSHLSPQTGYDWRVRAIGSAGQLLGQSDLQPLRTP